MTERIAEPDTQLARPEITQGMTTSAHIAYQMTIVANLMAFAGNARNVERFGLNFRQWRVVGAIGRTGPLTAHQIVDIVHQDKSSVSRAVSELSSRRLIRKLPNSQHRGSHILALTDAGQTLYERILPVWEAQASENVATLTSGEQRLLCELLDRLKTHLKQLHTARETDSS
jgi:MarR family transcriptional regulator, 2-MHQ and catechol-resistance regulon repressor